MYRRALLLPRIDVSHDAVVLDLRDLRALVDAVPERVAQLDGPGLLREPLQELVVYSGLDKDARPSAARLSMIPAIKLSSVRDPPYI